MTDYCPKCKKQTRWVIYKEYGRNSDTTDVQRCTKCGYERLRLVGKEIR